MVLAEGGFADACVVDVIVLTRLEAPGDYQKRCRLRTFIEAQNLTQQGGAMIYRATGGLRIVRSFRPGTARPWTPRVNAIQE